MKTLERFISSSVTTIVLLLIYAFGLAIATFIEKYHGTAAAKAMIYYSPVFFTPILIGSQFRGYRYQAPVT